MIGHQKAPGELGTPTFSCSKRAGIVLEIRKPSFVMFDAYQGRVQLMASLATKVANLISGVDVIPERTDFATFVN